MAKMLPEIEPNELEHQSEAVVYEALRDGLPWDYTVLHSYPWLRPWRGDGAILEGEADFLIVHRERGLLVLEVKGGDVCLVERDWFRQTSTGLKRIKDPFEQARKNAHALTDIIWERSARRLRAEMITHGYAVVFPHLDYDGPLPNNAEAGIIISRRDLSTIAEKIELAFDRWTAAPRHLSPSDYNLLLNQCLLPKFRRFRPIGADVEAATQRLLELTEEQAQVFEGLFDQTRVVVEGVAGSGKTFLALHRALAYAREGNRTLFVCFNKHLARWLGARAMEDPSIEPHREVLEIIHFHKLASELAREARIPFEPAGGGELTQAFWDDEVPDIIEQAVEVLERQGREVRYDAIVVDEAQDFCVGWWYALVEGLLADPSSGPLYVFLDPNQSLRKEVEAPPFDLPPPFKLSINCRNTKRIAHASAHTIGQTARVFKRAPGGAPLRVLRAKTPQQAKGLVLEELRRLITLEEVRPAQIAVVGPASKEKGSLAGVEAVDNVPLVTDVEAWHRGAGILVTTARAFKGLEADIVLLYDVSGLNALFGAADLYVACTRARYLLTCVAMGGAARDLLESAASAAEVGA